MKKKKSKKTKGFGTPPSRKYKQFECNESGELKLRGEYRDPEIEKQLDLIESKTKANQKNPSALAKFQKLVESGDPEKLTEYFKQYGIDPQIARLGLESLIAEELRDLSR